LTDNVRRYNQINKKLSCCCDSRSYCLRRTANYQTGFGYKFTHGWYARFGTIRFNG